MTNKLFIIPELSYLRKHNNYDTNNDDNTNNNN